MGGPAFYGMKTTTRWLAWACGLSDRTAVDHVRVARALAAHPPLVEAMTAGRMSYSQARAISRVARLSETALVADLIEVSRHGTVRHLESIVRGLRTVRDGEVRPDEAVRRGWTDYSQWRLSARLDPERGAVVATALDQVAAAEDLNREDALVRLAEIALAALADANGGEPRHLRGAEASAVVVHIDASSATPASEQPTAGSQQATTTGADTEPVGDRPEQTGRSGGRSGRRSCGSLAAIRARIDDGPGLPAGVVERLACAGRVRLAVRDGDVTHSDVLDLGRSRRLVSDRQYRALLLRQGRRCGHPGCAHRRFLEAHHVRHWLDGGPTDLNNLILLCSRHHADHHDGKYSIEAVGRGQFRFFLPDGRELPVRPDAEPLVGSQPPVEDEHGDVTADAATTLWDGRRLDHRYAIDGLAQHLQDTRRLQEAQPLSDTQRLDRA